RATYVVSTHLPRINSTHTPHMSPAPTSHTHTHHICPQRHTHTHTPHLSPALTSHTHAHIAINEHENRRTHTHTDNEFSYGEMSLVVCRVNFTPSHRHSHRKT